VRNRADRRPTSRWSTSRRAKSITDYADAKHLDTRRRLELFLQVCDAMQYGHQRGVIHRDLKPANILVDTGGRVKIIDLGVARTTDSDIAVTTMRTDVGQLIGTVQYMSPEQCEADPAEIDTRSDVYALGVVLYELVCEKLPYEVSRTSIVESIRVVRERTMPLRPSAVRHGLSRNLEAILLKALEKRRESRYQSAADLGQDIRKYLAGEPVSARRPTFWSGLARYIVRRPKTATFIVCLLIVITTLLATSLSIHWYNRQPFEMKWTKENEKHCLLRAADAT
jgi:serine/threonine protein kinase